MSEPISDERIAELLDGRLPEAERQELLARLAASGEDWSVFAEAGGVLREAEESESETETEIRIDPPPAERERTIAAVPATPRQEPPSVRQPGRWGRRPARWMALAAVLALAVLGPVLWTRSRGGAEGPGAPAALLASRDALPAGWGDERPWESSLGAGDPLSPGARAARVGALHTDLAVAAGAGDAAATSRLANEIAALLDAEPGGGPAATAYRQLAARAGEPASALRDPLDDAGDAAASLVDGERMTLAAWTEAARIAAARQDAAFFRASATRDALARAAEDSGLSADARQAAARVSGPNVAAAGWPSITRDLDTLLRAIAS